jgi:hypothetical protein
LRNCLKIISLQLKLKIMRISTKRCTNVFTAYIKTFITIFFFSSLLLASKTFGQATNLDQIRNGPANDPSKNFYNTFPNPSWANGNAGASNAHYVEGMSIAYRSLLTGLTAGTSYEYVIEYDTYHGAMAIDYLTHYQRLEPHGPFGHPAEVIDPAIFTSGSKEYKIGLITVNPINTLAIGPPAASGITGGSTLNISGQPTASSNALPAKEKLMTIYNGVINSITYDHQDPIAISGNTNTATRIRIRLTAGKDSVLLAWGGHIASRLDWGSSTVTGKVLSAAGISGSPYHMRQISMNKCAPALTNIPIGNQDRSLSAAAVIAAPLCPTAPSQTKCVESTSYLFPIDNPDTATTYTWSFGSNNVNAAFQGSNIGNSVIIIHSGGGSFTNGGSFTLDISASLNGVTQTCRGVATGTVVKVVVHASANPTTIDLTSAAHSTTLTADIDATSSDPNTANYTYQWSVETAGAAGSLSNATSRVATYTAGTADAGSVQFKVIATQTAAPNCSDDDLVGVTFTATGPCNVTAQGPVCQGATTTHNGSPDPKPGTATYTWSLQGYSGTGTTTSTLNTAVTPNGGVSMQVIATQSYRIVLSEVYANTAFNTACYQDVEVIPTPTVTTQYNAPSCSEKTFTVDVISPTAGYTYSITQPGNPQNLNLNSPQTPTEQSPAVHFTGLTDGDGFTVTVTTDKASCTVTSSCATNPTPGSPAVATNTVARSSEPYNIVLGSPTKVSAVPNPYIDKIRFNLVSAVSGIGKLELFNLLGQKVVTVFEGYVQAGRELTKEYNAPGGQRNTLIYVFKVGDQKVSGKLIGLK